MLSIYICEDDKFQLEQIKECIDNCIIINEYDMKISGCYTNPSICISQIKTHTPLHGIYFLDIDLKADINGIELATQIRKTDPRAFIIFITTHEEMSIVTFQYKVEALDFIIKEDTVSLSKRISDCLSNILDKQSLLSPIETNKIHFSFQGKDYFIRKQDIFYIDATNDHKFTVHHSTGLLEIRGKLSELINTLDSTFFQSHRGCIVNLQHITGINSATKEIVLDNSTSCPCAKKNFPIIRKLLSQERNKNCQ